MLLQRTAKNIFGKSKNPRKDSMETLSILYGGMCGTHVQMRSAWMKT